MKIKGLKNRFCLYSKCKKSNMHTTPPDISHRFHPLLSFLLLILTCYSSFSGRTDWRNFPIWGYDPHYDPEEWAQSRNAEYNPKSFTAVLWWGIVFCIASSESKLSIHNSCTLFYILSAGNRHGIVPVLVIDSPIDS